MGLEPTRATAHKNLNLARLPIPTLPHTYLSTRKVYSTWLYVKSQAQIKNLFEESLNVLINFIIL